MSEIQNVFKEQQYLNREQVIHDFYILDDELVLDVACGPGAPEVYDRDTHFQRADILVDSCVDLIQIYKHTNLKFVVASIEALPFKDKVFGFIWSSHTLEHIENPREACKELSRVGYRGRILTPSKFKELIRPNSEHLWMVSSFKDHIVFEKKFNFLHSGDWKTIVFSEAADIWLKTNWENLKGALFEVVFDWFDSIDCIEIIETENFLEGLNNE